MKIVSSDSQGFTVRITRKELDHLRYVIEKGCDHLDELQSVMDGPEHDLDRREWRKAYLRGMRFLHELPWVGRIPLR